MSTASTELLRRIATVGSASKHGFDSVCCLQDNDDLAQTLLKQIKDNDEAQATEAEIAAAREAFGSDDIEIDDNATTSKSEEGTWVSAWVWIGK